MLLGSGARTPTPNDPWASQPSGGRYGRRSAEVARLEVTRAIGQGGTPGSSTAAGLSDRMDDHRAAHVQVVMSIWCCPPARLHPIGPTAANFRNDNPCIVAVYQAPVAGHAVSRSGSGGVVSCKGRFNWSKMGSGSMY